MGSGITYLSSYSPAVPLVLHSSSCRLPSLPAFFPLLFPFPHSSFSLPLPEVGWDIRQWMESETGPVKEIRLWMGGSVMG